MKKGKIIDKWRPPNTQRDVAIAIRMRTEFGKTVFFVEDGPRGLRIKSNNIDDLKERIQKQLGARGSAVKWTERLAVSLFEADGFAVNSAICAGVGGFNVSPVLIGARDNGSICHKFRSGWSKEDVEEGLPKADILLDDTPENREWLEGVKRQIMRAEEELIAFFEPAEFVRNLKKRKKIFH